MPGRAPRSNPLDYVSYIIAAVSLVGGAVVVEGSRLPNVPREARLTFGVVLLLMGIYRIVLTRTRAQHRAWEARFEAERAAERERRERSDTL